MFHLPPQLSPKTASLQYTRLIAVAERVGQLGQPPGNQLRY